MARPLYFDTINNQIEEMTDTDLIRLAYNCQVAYAAYLKGTSNNRGCVFPSGNSGDMTNIGSASDTSSTVQSASNPKPGTETTSDDNAYPSAPGLGTETDNTYNYQERKDPNVGAFGGLALPADGHYDAYGYLRIVNTYDLQTVNGYSGFSELLSVIDSQMQTNEVGTYRIAASGPVSGGAGTWSNEGTWYIDTTYSAGSTTYNYYLKEALDTPPGSVVEPLGYDQAGPGAGTHPADWTINRHLHELLWQRSGSYDKGILHGKDITSTAKLVTDIILRMMIYRDNNTRPSPQYTVRTSTSLAAGQFLKGQWTDTKQTSASNAQSFSHPNYITTSTPTGGASTVTTYELIAEWN